MKWLLASLWFKFLTQSLVEANDANADTTPSGESIVIDDGFAPMTDERRCSGKQVEADRCPDLKPCDSGVVPIDCSWRDWVAWSDYGGCSGLMVRSREVSRANNEKGKPCSGAKTETKKADVIPDRCLADCKLGDWGEWSKCSNGLDQSFRTRDVLKFPSAGGKACADALNVTRACGEKQQGDECTFMDWSVWSSCSADCGLGHQMRFRGIKNHATLKGTPCKGDLQTLRPCNGKFCKADRNCSFTDWTPWSDCKSACESKKQRYRHRDVKVTRAGNGMPCDGDLQQTSECAAKKVTRECKISDWTEWDKCDRTCDGGQSHRTRTLIQQNDVDNEACAFVSLHDVQGCNTQPCNPHGDCVLSEWGDWGHCSVPCGEGVTVRTRFLLRLALENGDGCRDNTKEVQPCMSKPCTKRDCKWSEWHPWSACSVSCGGGTHTRERQVAVAPLGEGKLCEPLSKEEITPCNTQRCADCIDGKFNDWSEWTTCSATCDSGFKSRHRDIAVHPNCCGKPIEGDVDEYAACEANVPCIENVDCKLSAWGDWGACSSTCNGVREHTRTIQEFARGSGKPCVDEALKEIEACSTSAKDCGEPEMKPCTLGDWSDWDPCTAPCNGGQTTRTRYILAPAELGGKPCEDSLSETTICHAQPCDTTAAMDCIWGDWQAWGDCTRCGNQRFRHRSPLQMANKFGKLCDPGDSKQLGPCESGCMKKRYCMWTEWGDYGDCSADCGPSVKSRQRSLTQVVKVHYEEKDRTSYLFEGFEDMSCGGTQLQIEKCDTKSCEVQCVKKDAELGAWSDWSSPTCTQLCERYRIVEKEAACGGEPVVGPLVSTKTCKFVCTEPEDCNIGEWQDWSDCKSPTSQRFHTRYILRVPANGGKPCTGPLEETGSCSPSAKEPVDCDFTAWSDWDVCSVTCGQGYQGRIRNVKHPAEFGGFACNDALNQVRNCTVHSPDCGAIMDCKLADWSGWSECDGTQTFRKRYVLQEAAGFGSVPCSDSSLQEMASCSIVTDCALTEWSTWDECDKTCGIGQQNRQRQITTHPSPGGKPCPSNLMETQGCNERPCNKKRSCTLSDWSEWTSCSASCGVGQVSRKRFPTVGSLNCDTYLEETQPCPKITPCKVVDCVWREWELWSSCTCDCGGGQRTRDRHIAIAAQKGGKPCELSDKEQVEPCNTQSCEEREACRDGTWADWNEWQECSSTCEGGITWRSRQVDREPNHCGSPAVGSSQVTASCNDDVPCITTIDCALGDWSEWGECTQECDGVTTRSREILQEVAGGGKPCEDSLEELKGCAAEGCGEKEVECAPLPWGDWSECTATCGGGQEERHRELPPGASGQCGSHQLSQVRGCNMERCSKDCQPVDCTWGEWKPWGPCSHCGGQKRRHRNVLGHSECGGIPCTPGASEETVLCYNDEGCEALTVCLWADWGSWSACDAKCGQGSRTRERILRKGPKVEGMEGSGYELFDEDDEMRRVLKEAGHTGGTLRKLTDEDVRRLRERTTMLESRHLQDFIVAFACGGFCMVAAFLAMRLYDRSSRTRVGVSDHSQLTIEA